MGSHRQAALLTTPDTADTSPSTPDNSCYCITIIMSTTTELFSGIGDKNSSKVLAPPGGKSSIGFDAPTPAPIVPKNSASAQKAKDLSTNPLAPLEPSSRPATNTGAAGEKVQTAPERVGRQRGPEECPTGPGHPRAGTAKAPSGDSKIQAHVLLLLFWLHRLP